MEKMRGGNIRGLSLVMKRISVVVATYKDKLINLNKTIESVIYQTYKNWEIIIVDGADCGIKTADNIKVIKTPPRGISDAFNKGVEVARGNYMYFIGAGDYLWRVDVLEKMMKGVDKEKDMLVCGRINRVSEDGKIIRYTSTLNFKKWQLLYKMGLPHQALFTNKKFFEKYGMFDLNCKYSMDYELLLRAYKTWPGVMMKDVVVAVWAEGGIGKNRINQVLDEYRRIRIKNKITNENVINLIFWLSRLWLKMK
ncbi:MAG: Glycosyl transferase, family 2 [Candidatus Shapirobacteria bacterium GW2011_GWE1_38_92]|uniref:Glycosyl transferase, family 2 n=3 Tax=Candidatus Shapironibacteriota TaxID=1752721 RepID=A0A0G0JXV6_9BACT|nr:MAG: Glycosyl transferase, family 2 [Candidatus Shapirobacteria bacterium GW2011_GWE2_38_30]KKQ92829.1 MAG: Glycosyl transferase, family 2 [Candidatus Shapirobacteria bacterium GW2011_GWE1_38_92]